MRNILKHQKPLFALFLCVLAVGSALGHPLVDLGAVGALGAAMMIGELRGKLTMERRKLPQPDRAITGTAPNGGGSADKELARLEKEAERTGDRTKLIAYRRKLRA